MIKQKDIFFIGIAGTGMSALAQYLAGSGYKVSGSDRYFGAGNNDSDSIRQKLESEGIKCFAQDGTGISDTTDLVVVSTAIEDSVPEVQKAKACRIPIIKRSQLLAAIADSKKTIAIAGTSGKSTTSAMLFEILKGAGMDPGIISGAGLTSIIKTGKIGNAWVGRGDWLIIESDESDGSIVQYHPETGLLLNIDKDHQELDELISLFTTFRNNTRTLFITNKSHPLSARLSTGSAFDFSGDTNVSAPFMPADFQQHGLRISFTVKEQPFSLHTVGRHNMENAMAAIAAASSLGVPLHVSAKYLKQYEGIYRRHQLIGTKRGVTVIDDYAHNPVKCAASIQACQPVASKVIAWFQPHGYGPTRFLRHDFVEEISAALRPQDEIWMSEIFYAGGSTVKDISSADLINDIRAKGKQAFFVSDRNLLAQNLNPHLTEDCLVLLMGARDPGLEKFGKDFFDRL